MTATSKKLSMATAGAAFIAMAIGAAPAKAALLQFNFSSPSTNGVPGSFGSIFFDSSSPNVSASPNLGLYKNAVTDYNINIAGGSTFSPGSLSSSGEIFKASDAQISINPLLSSINFAFGFGAELNFNFAPGTITSTALPGVGEIGTPDTTSATFTPGSRFTAFLDKTSVSVVAVNPASVPETSPGLSILAFGALGAVSVLKRKHKSVSSVAGIVAEIPATSEQSIA